MAGRCYGEGGVKLREWQTNRLGELESATFVPSAYQKYLTILAYTFPPKGCEDEMFQWIKCSILHTWSLLGQIHTVIVANTAFATVCEFAAKYVDVVELQIAPAIIPGNIKTMSLDCIKNLHSRFSTPYVLIIQDDGFPLLDNIGDFIGRYDFIGAPIISYGWKRTLAYSIGLGSFNGGFSLRSKRLCEYASKMWFSFFSKFMPEEHRHLGEDFYYTTLLKFLPMTWLKFRFPTMRLAFDFAADSLDGNVAIPYGLSPFGFHGKDTFERLHWALGGGNERN